MDPFLAPRIITRCDRYDSMQATGSRGCSWSASG